MIFIEGVTLALIRRISDESAPISPIAICQETLALILCAFGCNAREADLIAAQAAAEIVELGSADQAVQRRCALRACI